MPRRTSPRGPLPPLTDAETTRAFTVVLEDVRSNMKILAEGLSANTAAIGRLDKSVVRLEDRVGHMEDRVGHVEDRVGRVEDATLVLTHEVRGLRGDVAGLRQDFENRPERRPA